MTIPIAIRTKCMAEFQECPGCGTPKNKLHPTNIPTMDHIYPRSMGGGSMAENLIVVCRTCNSHRGDTFPWDWHGAQHRIYANGYPLNRTKRNKAKREANFDKQIGTALACLFGQGPFINPAPRGLGRRNRRRQSKL